MSKRPVHLCPNHGDGISSLPLWAVNERRVHQRAQKAHVGPDDSVYSRTEQDTRDDREDRTQRFHGAYSHRYSMPDGALHFKGAGEMDAISSSWKCAGKGALFNVSMTQYPQATGGKGRPLASTAFGSSTMPTQSANAPLTTLTRVPGENLLGSPISVPPRP